MRLENIRKKRKTLDTREIENREQTARKRLEKFTVRKRLNNENMEQTAQKTSEFENTEPTAPKRLESRAL